MWQALSTWAPCQGVCTRWDPGFRAGLMGQVATPPFLGPFISCPWFHCPPPPFSVSRFGGPSDHHHHRLPHHGHSCSDYNSCLKKLVRILGPSGLETGISRGPRGSTHRKVLAFQAQKSPYFSNAISAHSPGNCFSVWDGEQHAAPDLLNPLTFARAAWLAGEGVAP